jgi:NAD(P)-dependent dehydrogenase (short-subunit alcohol dehydrogenase family)
VSPMSTPQVGEETLSACREAFFQAVDVTDAASVRQMYEAAVERYGGVDVLYNNAGVMPAGDESVVDTDETVWKHVLRVNATGVFLCCKHGIPHLLARGGGSVIDESSNVTGATFLVDGRITAAYVTPE